MKNRGISFTLILALAEILLGCTGHKPEEIDKVLVIQAKYSIASGVVYKTVDSLHLALDVYSPVVLLGESAGGHLALLTGLKYNYPCKLAGIINWYGISDMEELYKTWNNPAAFDRMTMSMGEATHEMLRRNSPINCVNSTDVPVISIHGDHDMVVPIAQSQILH